MTPSSPLVTVVVVNFNSGRYLAECLEALSAQTYPGFRAIVIDNASSDESVVRARRAVDDPRIVFKVLPENLGFAAANNLAVREADTPWIATLNPDAFPEPDWLNRMLEATARHPDVPMFGATLLDAETPGRLDGAGDNYSAVGIAWRGGHHRIVPVPPSDYEVFAPCAAAAVYRRDAFLAQGGFDERFFCFMEDVDLAFRLRLAGGRCIHVTGARVRHVGGGSGGRNRRRSDFWGFRNRIWTFVKNMPGPLFWPLFPAHLLANLALLVLAVPQGRVVGVSAGILAGLRGIPAFWRERRKIHAAAIAGPCAIARALTWSPMKLLKRTIVPL